MLDDFYAFNYRRGWCCHGCGTTRMLCCMAQTSLFRRYAITLRPFRRSSSLAITDKYHSVSIYNKRIVAFALLFLQKGQKLSSDTLLGLLAHSTIALGLIALSFMTWVRVDLMGFLFGDILSITKRDILIIWVGGLLVLICLILIWKKLFAATVSPEIAEAEGLNPSVLTFLYDHVSASYSHFYENRRCYAVNSIIDYPRCISTSFFYQPRANGYHSNTFRY